MEKIPFPFTPVPNTLLDGAMPGLRDTELRVLLVVCRATLGWKDRVSGGRKQSEWLSHEQLVRKTGRQGAAVSRAVDTLVLRGLLIATDRRGRPLTTRRGRRGARLRLRLSPTLSQGRLSWVAMEREVRKAKRTKESFG